jgi:hypothetical protein
LENYCALVISTILSLKGGSTPECFNGSGLGNPDREIGKRNYDVNGHRVDKFFICDFLVFWQDKMLLLLCQE